MSEKTITYLYDNTVRVEFSPKAHRYYVYVNDVKQEDCSGVTTILGVKDKSGPLIHWATNLMHDYLLGLLLADEQITEEHLGVAKNKHRERLNEAGDIGTAVHSWAENHIKGVEQEMPADVNVRKGVEAFLQLVKDYGVRFVDSERIVYSKKYNYVGTVDCTFTLEAESHKILHVGDFKTGGGIYDTMAWQVSAYEEALTEETGQVFGDKWIMRFIKEDKIDKKTGEVLQFAGQYAFAEFPSYQHAGHFEAFLACKTIFFASKAFVD